MLAIVASLLADVSLEGRTELKATFLGLIQAWHGAEFPAQAAHPQPGAPGAGSAGGLLRHAEITITTNCPGKYVQ